MDSDNSNKIDYAEFASAFHRLTDEAEAIKAARTAAAGAAAAAAAGTISSPESGSGGGGGWALSPAAPRE